MRKFTVFLLLFVTIAYSTQQPQSSNILITVGEYRYCEQDLLGRGGFGYVFRGHRIGQKSVPVAIKKLSVNKYVEKEVRILYELSKLNQPNLVKLLHYQKNDKIIYIVMEFCNGGDLHSYLRKNGKLSEETIKIFLQQIVNGLSAVYEKDIIHRDLKPANILFSIKNSTSTKPEDMTLKIADFGISRFLEDGDIALTRIGTRDYTAPEVYQNQGYGRKVDMYSLGIIVFQMLTGKMPFPVKHPRHPNAIPQFSNKTSDNLRDIINGLLAYDSVTRMSFEELKNHPFLQDFSTYIPTLELTYGQIEWKLISVNNSSLPYGKLSAGTIAGDSRIYVGRCNHGGGTYPAKIVLTNDKLEFYVFLNGRSIAKDHCEILVISSGKIRWIAKEDGVIPSNAIEAGKTQNGESVYIGRKKYSNDVIVGGIRRSRQQLGGIHKGRIVTFSQYEILVDKTF